MRAFVAVDISKEVVISLERLIESEKKRLPKARWLRPANLHLTLRFLGETLESILSEMGESLETSMAQHQSFTLDYRGVGFFPSSRRPRVFWVDVPHPPAALVRVQQEIETVAQKHGFEPETRKFSPHLTLARFREPRPDRRFAELEKELEHHHFGASLVQELVLYRSILKPKGAEYQALQRFPLSGAQ